MKTLAALALTCVTGCQLVFALDPPDTPIDATHVPEDDAVIGISAIELVDVTIDTTELTITPPIDAVELVAVPQDTGGPELAVVRGLGVVFRGTIKVIGTRPLVVLGRTIEVRGILDASADGATPGPNGLATDGTGGNGIHTGGGSPNTADGGGGGGGFGTDGGAGGNSCMTSGDSVVDATGGSPGTAHGDALVILQGGSAGGAGAQDSSVSEEIECSTASRGGGGGGAIQLSAQDEILVAGVVDVGGGGGEGGVACLAQSAGGGSGGGSGGAIFVEAPRVTIAGTLAANGGGGGGGGHARTATPFTFAPGQPGDDAMTIVAPARAGMLTGDGFNGTGQPGGDGGCEGMPPTDGVAICLGQAGGGGGAVGRIVLHGEVTLEPASVTTPMAAIFARE